MGRKILKLLIAISILTILVLTTGCELFFDTRIKASDPYDAECNLKESYHKDWKKYSDFDYRIEANTRSYEATQYYAAVEEIAIISGTIHMLERDRAVRSLMIEETRAYKQAISTGHKQNLIKSFIRLSFYTAEVIKDNANVGKGFATTLLDPKKNAIQLVGEGIKIAEAYVPDNSSLALDTSTTKDQMLDVSKTGALELMTKWGEEGAVKGTKDAMKEKAWGYVNEHIESLYPHKPGVKYVPLPDIKLSDEDFAILKQEHLKLHELDNLIQDAEKQNFQDMWAIRELTQEQTNLKNKLFDLEYDEKDRVDAMLIADCKRKTGTEEDGLFSFLNFLGGNDK